MVSTPCSASHAATSVPAKTLPLSLVTRLYDGFSRCSISGCSAQLSLPTAKTGAPPATGAAQRQPAGPAAPTPRLLARGVPEQGSPQRFRRAVQQPPVCCQVATRCAVRSGDLLGPGDPESGFGGPVAGQSACRDDPAAAVEVSLDLGDDCRRVAEIVPVEADHGVTKSANEILPLLLGHDNLIDRLALPSKLGVFGLPVELHQQSQLRVAKVNPAQERAVRRIDPDLKYREPVVPRGVSPTATETLPGSRCGHWQTARRGARPLRRDDVGFCERASPSTSGVTNSWCNAWSAATTAAANDAVQAWSSSVRATLVS